MLNYNYEIYVPNLHVTISKKSKWAFNIILLLYIIHVYIYYPMGKRKLQQCKVWQL